MAHVVWALTGWEKKATPSLDLDCSKAVAQAVFFAWGTQGKGKGAGVMPSQPQRCRAHQLLNS